MNRPLTRRDFLVSGAVLTAAGVTRGPAQLLGGDRHLFSSPRTLLTQPVQVRPDFVGMHIHRWPSGSPLSPAPTYPFGAARSHDYAGLPHGISWHAIHLGPNLYDWSAMDLWVSTHTAQRRTLTYTVFGTPAWVTAAPELKDAYGNPGGASPPRDLQMLHDFIQALVSRYNARQTKISFIEIWNEPHFEQRDAQFWWGTAPDLASMGRVIYQAAKAADPNIRVLTPGFIPGATVPLSGDLTLTSTSPAAAQTGSLYQYLTASDGAGSVASRWCDGIAFHAYNPRITTATQGLEGEVHLLRKLLGLMNLRRPIYLTETGFFPTSDFARLTVQDKATVLRRLGVTVAALGIDIMHFYAHDDDFIGNPSKNPPISAAIGDLHQRLAGKTLNQVTILPGGAYNVQSSGGDFFC